MAAEAAALGVESLAVVADVADEPQVGGMFAAAIERFGKVDILVSNAAIRPHKPFLELTLEDYERVRAGGARRGVLLRPRRHSLNEAQRLRQNSVPDRRRRVERFGPTLPRFRRQDGRRGAGQGPASEFAPDNIRVNVVSPGRIDTTRDLAWYPQQNMAETSEIPLGRWARSTTSPPRASSS